ncbi:M48 family peptidase [Marinifilum breve]|uniref:M48 family peptidase n=1 Tax=Marinifilum breve TaxID=2184082 RepID=A0A2V4A1Q2_9BACT|nr:SprT family zinc-dependent metalloprotease [Marinifilum breve]PXY02531.1 M48 family peptidase [Marinifilum breve]
MNKVPYGNTSISYVFEENKELKSHYITVERDRGVVLKGKAISQAQADALILKKAAWIIEKLEMVRSIDTGKLQTGSRITYLGRSYYLSIIEDESYKKIEVQFTWSKFIVHLPKKLHSQEKLADAIAQYLRKKAISKISQRVSHWEKQTGLKSEALQFMKMNKRWGSCTQQNKIIINVDAIKLPWPLIDYLLVHELVHTKVKSHSKEFWAELSKHMPNWKQLDERMGDMKV